MILVPENIKYQAAENIELLPCAFMTGQNGAILSVSNVDGFANGQAITIQPKNGSPSFLTLAGSNAVDKANKTLTLSGVPAEAAGTNEVQTATGGVTVAGSYALVFDGYSTPALAAAAVAATVQAALEALPSIGTGNILVAGGPLNSATPMTFTFQGALAKKNVNLIVVNSVAVTAGTISIVQTTPGVPYSPLPSINSTILGPELLALGGTTGGVQFSAKPDNVNVEYDQKRVDVDVVQVHYTVEARGTLMEFDAKQWGMVSQQGYRLRSAATGIPGATIIDFMGRAQRFGARFTFPKQDPNNALKDYLLLYRIASMEGIETSLGRRDPTNLPFTFHCLSDPGRAAGSDVYEIIQETAAAL
jgi:hypothetical protein